MSRAVVHAPTARPPRSAQRGSTLLESLLAFVLLATGTLAVASLQGSLRLHTEVARQRSEAVRVGQEQLEAMRAFSAMSAASPVTAYDAIDDADLIVDRTIGHDANTAYRVARRIDSAGIAGAKSASVTVAWADRSGAPQGVRLDSVVAGVDPAYSAALALGAGDGLARGVLGRSPLVPIDAHALGDGRSVWKPMSAGTTAVIFDDRSGDIVARCTGIGTGRLAGDLNAADLTGCVRGAWASVAGVIRFSATRPPEPLRARDAAGAVAASLALAGTGYPAAPECSSEPMKDVRYLGVDGLHVASVALDATPASLGVTALEDTGERFVAYRCIVAPRPDGHWSGRVVLVPTGWSVGTGAADHRVCRYAGDSADSAAVGPRIGHPVETVDGSGSLTGQNFLVVGGDQSCPVATAATPTVAAFAGTVQHQP